MTRLLANGCFDGVHQGHVNFLNAACRLGVVYVAMNTDASVTRIKGVGRPIMNWSERCKAILNYCPLVSIIVPIIEDEDIVMQVHNNQIDFIVKGSDTLVDKKYDKVIGADECHGVIYIEHHIMDIHTKDYVEGKIPSLWKGGNGKSNAG